MSVNLLKSTLCALALAGTLGSSSVMAGDAARTVESRANPQQVQPAGDPAKLASATSVVALADVLRIVDQVLQGQVRGRVVVDVNA